MDKLLKFFLIPITSIMVLVGSLTFKSSAADFPLDPQSVSSLGSIISQLWTLGQGLAPTEEIGNRLFNIASRKDDFAVFAQRADDTEFILNITGKDISKFSSSMNTYFSTDVFSNLTYDDFINSGSHIVQLDIGGAKAYVVVDSSNTVLADTKPLISSVRNFVLSNSDVVVPDLNDFPFFVSQSGSISFVNRNNGRTYNVTSNSDIFYYYIDTSNPNVVSQKYFANLCAYSFAPFSNRDYQNYYVYYLADGTPIYNLLANVETIDRSFVFPNTSTQGSIFNDYFKPFVQSYPDLFGVGDDGLTTTSDLPILPHIVVGDDVIFDPNTEDIINGIGASVDNLPSIMDKLIPIDVLQGLLDDVFADGISKPGVIAIPQVAAGLLDDVITDAIEDDTTDPGPDPPDKPEDPEPKPPFEWPDDIPKPPVIDNFFDNFNGLDIFEPLFHLIPNQTQGALLYQVWLLIPTFAFIIVALYIAINVF